MSEQPEVPSKADEDGNVEMTQKEIQVRIEALKKSIPKGDKKKKRDVSAEIAILEHRQWELQDKDEEQKQQSATKDEEQKQQSATKDEEQKQQSATKDEEELIGGMQAVSVVKKNKAKKRREQKAERDRERAQRIADEEKEAELAENNPRVAERKKLSAILEPLGLVIKDIAPDGHCLYAAVSDQLKLRLGLKVKVSELRSGCASYIRSHQDDFLPYMANSNTGDIMGSERFEEYCHEIESTAAWGGLLELRALSSLYNVSISVYQASSPVIRIGETSFTENTLLLTYHLHEYGLGEHYNSLVPAV